MQRSSESMTHAYDVRTAGPLRTVAVRAVDGAHTTYRLSRDGIAAARRSAARARLALADAAGAASA
ncbi:hypothetical protein [Halarchaeum sp. P4]|uniref:hypothetical protein n=1 Tax=Halarchaeum sp. P4 TaxID=3421639 RepID=UPI003EB9C632